MSSTRWLLTVLSFAAALGASGYVVWASWPGGGAAVGLPLAAHLFGGGMFVLEAASRAAKIQLSARAMDLDVSFGAALRTSLGGDFGAAITPARTGAEPARYLVLAEARVAPAGRLLILFTEMVLEMLSLAVVVLALGIVFRGHAGRALLGVESLVFGYAAFTLGAGGLGLLLARRNASGPPPAWARRLGLNAARWRGVQRSLRQLRTGVAAVRHARPWAMTGAFLMSVVHIVARMLVLPGLLAGAGVLPGSRAALAPLLLWPMALQYGGVVAPAPGGGGFIEAAFSATLKGHIPAQVFGASLIWWRVYTFYAYVLLGGLAAGRTVLRALQSRSARKAARDAGPHAHPLDAPDDAAPDGLVPATSPPHP